MLGASTHIDARDELFRWLCQGSSPSIFGYVGETCFHDVKPQDNSVETVHDYGPAKDKDGVAIIAPYGHLKNCPTDFNYLPDHAFYSDLTGGGGKYTTDGANISDPATWDV